MVLAYGEREAIVMIPPPMHDSAISPCLHGCLAFLHRYFLPQSPLSCSMGLSPSSQQQTLPWDSSTISMLQLPASLLSRGLVSLSRVRLALAGVVCVILIPFRLSQISCFNLTASNASHLSQLIAFDVRISPLFQLSHRLGVGPVLLALLFFPSFFHPTEF